MVTCLSQLLGQGEVHWAEQRRKRWRNAGKVISHIPLNSREKTAASHAASIPWALLQLWRGKQKQ